MDFLKLIFKFLGKKSYDIDLIVKKKYFERFAEGIKALEGEPIENIPGALKGEPIENEPVVLEGEPVENEPGDEQQSFIHLSRGANEGLLLFRTALHVKIQGDRNGEYIEQSYQFDMRECEDQMSLDEDRKSRDFTVNAIYMWPDKKFEKFEFDFPKNGEFDIFKKIAKTVNSLQETFSSDPGRFLRALRLKTQYGFTLDVELDDYIKNNANYSLTKMGYLFRKEFVNKKFFETRDQSFASLMMLDDYKLYDFSEGRQTFSLQSVLPELEQLKPILDQLER